MLGFTIRSISAVFAFVYTFISLITFTPQPDPAADVVQRPVEGIAIGQSGGQTHPPSPPVVVHILQSREEISLPLQRAVELYRQETGDVRISVETVPGVPEYQAALRAKLVSGQKADVFQVFGERDARSLGRQLTDLSGLEWLHGAMDGTLDAVTIDDGIYGIPYSLEGVGLIANKAMFDAAEISLDNIGDYEGLRKMFREMREKIRAGELREDYPDLVVVTELPAGSSVYLGRQMADIALSGAFNSQSEAANATVMGMQAGGKAAESYLRLLASYTYSRNDWTGLTGVSQYRQLDEGLAAGRVAMIHQNADVYRSLIAANPDIAEDLVLLPIPLEDDEQSAIYTGVPAYWAVNLASEPEVREAAMAFLTWLYQSETGAKIVAEEFGAVSVFRDNAANTGNPLHRQMLDYVRRGKSKPWLHVEAPAGWGSEAFAPAVRSWLNDGGQGWDGLMDECMQQWNRMSRE